MAKKFVADPEKRRRRQEELSRIAGVPIEPATEAEAAAFNTRIGQIERAPKLDVTTTEADAKPEVADVQAPEVAPVTDESPEPQIEARESMLQGDQPASLPEEPLVASGDLVESDEPVVPKAIAADLTLITGLFPEVADAQVPEVAPEANVPPGSHIKEAKAIPQVDQPTSLPDKFLAISGDSVEPVEPEAPDAITADPLPQEPAEAKRNRGRPRVIPFDARGVLVRTPPDIKKQLSEFKEGEGPAGLRLFRLALDLINAAGGIEVAQDAVAMTRLVISADNKNVAAQAARQMFLKHRP